MRIYKHLTANSLKLKKFDFKKELSMEAYLIEHPSVLSLDDDDKDIEIIQDELPILGGRSSKVTDGRIDLVAYYSSKETLGIIEIKKGEISTTDISQLDDYMFKKNEVLDSIRVNNNGYDDLNPQWIGILVGTSISKDLVEFIDSGKTLFDNIPLVGIIVSRYQSEDGHFFIATETYQKLNKMKDFSKYEFNGTTYGKGRLVLAVIKHFVLKNPQIKFSELKNEFPNDLQGSHGVFVTQEDAIETNSKGRTRYFTGEDEIIRLSDEISIAISSQWGKENIKKILEKFKKLNIKIGSAD